MPISGKFKWPKITVKEYGVSIPYDMGLIRKPKKREDWVLVGDTECVRTTERALLIRAPRMLGKRWLTNLDVEFWIPKSQLHPTENEVSRLGDKGFLVIPEWLAKEKGLLK